MNTINDNMISPLPRVLKQLMQEKQLTEAELARQTNVPQPTLHRILSGATKSPRGDSLSPLAKFFSVSISQLVGDEPLMQRMQVPTWLPVPIISWHQAFDWAGIDAGQEPTEWTYASHDATTNHFALVVESDQLSPRFRAGTQLIVKQQASAEHKDYVIIKTAQKGPARCRQLFAEGDLLLLQGLNNETTARLFNQFDQIIGIVVQAREQFS